MKKREQITKKRGNNENKKRPFAKDDFRFETIARLESVGRAAKVIGVSRTTLSTWLHRPCRKKRWLALKAELSAKRRAQYRARKKARAQYRIEAEGNPEGARRSGP